MKYKAAFVTLATTRKYLEGAKHLYQTYLATKHKYPFHIMVLPTTDITGYEDLPLIQVMDLMGKEHKQGIYSYPSTDGVSIDVFNKFNMLLLNQYDYVMFVDADMVFTQNNDMFLENCCYQLQEDNKDMMAYFVLMSCTPHKITSEGMVFKTSTKIFNLIVKEIPNHNLEETLLYKLYQQNLLTCCCLNEEIAITLTNRGIHEPYVNSHTNGNNKKYGETIEGESKFQIFLNKLKR